MPNSPVQVVLNTNDFIVSRDKSGGGFHKDFYAGRDAEFINHKNKILTQLNTIRKNQNENEYSEVSFAKLTLNPLALAKSHRPTQTIFRRDITPIVGAGDLGELFVELQPSSIKKVYTKVEDAEEETHWEFRDEKWQPKPSRLRSELGSIEKISSYTAADKRKFSINDGLEWISDLRTGGAYIVELFETPPPKQDWDNLSDGKFKLYESFLDGLRSFRQGLFAFRLVGSDEKAIMMEVRLEESTKLSSIQFMPTQSSIQRPSRIINVNQDASEHAKLLKFLDSHPLVKKIVLPPIVTQSHAKTSRQIGDRYSVPAVEEHNKYPIVGIVDGGVSPIMGDWIEDRWGLLSREDKNETHGTFIAGLVLSSSSLNGKEVCKELDGCKIVDIDIFPKEGYFQDYHTSVSGFLEELEIAVRELKARAGVRIFNFSLNIEEHLSSDVYSPHARILDGIAEKNDVIFVISAGNMEPNDFRREWPADHLEAISVLASAENDKIKTPAQSFRNISVSALNPPNLDGIVPFAPSRYSCRGKGIRVGLKPDLAHVGGSGTKIAEKGHGLYSADTNGQLIDDCGTSYAVPHVVKTLASVDQSIEGDVSRETLIALLIHHASLPEVLAGKQLKDIAKQLVGFGMPVSSIDILEGSENSITLVFANRIQEGRQMSFKFVWPPSLVKNKKCYGHAKLTLVSTPPFDYRFGSEFVRINIDGRLRQEQQNGTYASRLKPVYLPEKSPENLYEKSQIKHAFKWSPIKVSESKFRGRGPSTNWELYIEYLTRDGERLPGNGVPFTALLTISDLDNSKPVFNDMRQSLQSSGAKIVDIKEAARILRRV